VPSCDTAISAARLSHLSERRTLATIPMIVRRTPLRRRKRIRLRRPEPRRGPDRDDAYLAWIRTLCCAVCGRDSGVEAAHTPALGVRGLSQKSSDYSAIPLCFGHHRGNADSYHCLGERKFVEMHGLDIRELVQRLIPLYRGDCKGPTAPDAGQPPIFGALE
jgi:hypothetical protein